LARCLIIGCGCRGRSLARELVAGGHAVRGTSRAPDRLAAIEAAGAEAVLGDPDVIATLARSLEHVSVACILLGSAVGNPERLAALHGTRLDMLLTRMVDTTVRGVVYEAAGSVEPGLLDAGAALVRGRCEDTRIPYALLRAEAADAPAWTSAAVAAVNRTLAGEPVRPR
jgi:nucleoside-diphosphate-sugar epimerase